jgi:hypothetical protein
MTVNELLERLGLKSPKPEAPSPRKIWVPFIWKQGEHMTAVGLTGSGKSTLMSQVLGLRRFLLVLRSKADSVKYPVERISRTHAPMTDGRLERLEIFPRRSRMAYEFFQALKKVFEMGGWTTYTDELFKLHKLGLQDVYEECYTQLRSNFVSMVGGIQRPVDVTRFAMGESTHLISFGLEGRDAKTVGEAASPRMVPIVTQLRRYEFAWWYQPDKEIWVGRYNAKTGQLEGRYTDGHEYERPRSRTTSGTAGGNTRGLPRNAR